MPHGPDLEAAQAPPRLQAPKLRWLLVCGLIAAHPLLAAFAGSGVGGFSMFTRPVEYRLDVVTFDGAGFPTRVTSSDLAPHLSRDGRRVLRGSERFLVGETNASLLAKGLDAIGALACDLDETADRARVTLVRRSLRAESAETRTRAEVRCVAPTERAP